MGSVLVSCHSAVQAVPFTPQGLGLSTDIPLTEYRLDVAGTP
jgi:hypothetical protein